MSIDHDAERCPHCGWPGIDKVRNDGEWFSSCRRCYHRDDGYDQALTAAQLRAARLRSTSPQPPKVLN